MFGLAYLVFFAVYLLMSIAAVRGAIGYARKNGKSAKRWGWGLAFVMYSLVFWDWIPTVAVHQYYCAKDSGFWVYKTLDQWKTENPGVMEGLVSQNRHPGAFSPSWPSQGELRKDGHELISTDFINDRFNVVVSRRDVSIFPIVRSENTLIDIKKYEVVGRYVGFSSYDKKWGGLKFWTSINNCAGGRDQRINFGKFYLQFQGVEK